ncbi:hypothetical protein J7547_03245 [Wohlfahrtiimonas chitiniclastica]|uniref:PIN-like domain-containing protein n=1 Tax=Wohlfahrtiimonas chitiniclastica TaxID=400946 RepID=A0AB35BZH7_9GAMM|nr:PIN domain-containing protein [Wohlfahrtiimonas chitiniclastica]MBS7824307.1 hypothetical protein [Wohlfahrtiimonas chitiniclastica]MBS7839833.1 hypothetical protein [Wohlfahrtiimonas chitiniclastica]
MEEKTNYQSLLLIDIENCPSKIEELIQDFQIYQKIVICYAQTGVKIPLDWLMILKDCVAKDQLELVKMCEVGNNSADFGITFLLGRYFDQFDHFVIYSNDKGFDVIIELVSRSENKHAERIGKQDTVAQTLAAREVEPKVININSEELLALPPFKQAEQATLAYLSRLLINGSWPSKVQGFYNSIRTRLRFMACDDVAQEKLAHQIIECLIKAEVISVNDQQMVYHKGKIKSWVDDNL